MESSKKGGKDPYISGNSNLSRGISMCKGPGVAACSVCSRNDKNADVVGKE